MKAGLLVTCLRQVRIVNRGRLVWEFLGRENGVNGKRVSACRFISACCLRPAARRTARCGARPSRAVRGSGGIAAARTRGAHRSHGESSIEVRGVQMADATKRR